MLFLKRQVRPFYNLPWVQQEETEEYWHMWV